jgi:hypothetical protein
MRSTWSEPYLWLHLAGLAAVPVLLELCLVGLKTVNSPLALGLVALAGIGPIAWMQWNRPFSIFSLLPLVLQPNQLTETQRRILGQLKSPVGRVITLVVAVLALVLLWQLQRWLPYVRPVSLPGGRLGGLVLAAVTFLLSNLFLQVPASVVPVLLTGDRQLAEPYRVSQIPRDFTLIGLGVKQILPVAAPVSVTSPPVTPPVTPPSPVAAQPATPTPTPDNLAAPDLEKASASAASADPRVAPELIQAELVQPGPTDSDPSQPPPERIQAELITAEPVASELVTPELATPELATPEPVNSAPVGSAPVNSASGAPVAASPLQSPNQPAVAAEQVADLMEPVEPEPVEPEPVEPEPREIDLAEPTVESGPLAASVAGAPAFVPADQLDPVGADLVELASPDREASPFDSVAAVPLQTSISDDFGSAPDLDFAPETVQQEPSDQASELSDDTEQFTTELTEAELTEADLTEVDLTDLIEADRANLDIDTSAINTSDLASSDAAGAIPTVLLFQPAEPAQPVGDPSTLAGQNEAIEPALILPDANAAIDAINAIDPMTPNVCDTVVTIGPPIANPFDQPAVDLSQVEVFEEPVSAPHVGNTVVRVG